MNKLNRLFILLCIFNQRGEQSVIWTNKVLIAKPRHERTSLCADAGINNIDVNCVWREERHRAPKRERTFMDILRRDGVTDIDNFHLWSNAIDHSLHDTYKAIAESKVCGEGDDRHVFSLLRRSLCFFK